MWVSHPLLITKKEPPEGLWNRDITFKGHSYLVLRCRRQAYYDQHCVCEIGGTLFSGIYYEMNWKLRPTPPKKKGQKLWKGKTTSIYSSFASDAFCRYGLRGFEFFLWLAFSIFLHFISGPFRNGSAKTLLTTVDVQKKNTPAKSCPVTDKSLSGFESKKESHLTIRVIITVSVLPVSNDKCRDPVSLPMLRGTRPTWQT